VPIIPVESGDGVVIFSGGEAGLIVKVNGFDVPPPGPGLTTVMLAVPAVAMSLAGMDAVSCEVLAKVVLRAEPFHLTVESFTKFEPLTDSVTDGPPAVVELGLRLVMAGKGLATLIVKSLVAFASTPSVTCTLKLKFPADVGVPLTTPDDELSESPAGSVPALTDQV
jgi:hypothetical protein